MSKVERDYGIYLAHGIGNFRGKGASIRLILNNFNPTVTFDRFKRLFLVHLHFLVFIFDLYFYFVDDQMVFDCSLNNMTLHIPKNQSSNVDSTPLVTLRDTRCVASVNQTHYTLTTQLDDCGTIVGQDNETIYYENMAVIRPRESSNSMIMRLGDIDKTVEMKCLFRRMVTVKSSVFVLEGKNYF